MIDVNMGLLRQCLALPALPVCLALMPLPVLGEQTSRNPEEHAGPPQTRPAALEGEPRVTKIMPLGASNTHGMYENPNSPGGYRGPLYDLLTAEGALFDFVGLDNDGAIPDPDHNGYPGKPIDWFTHPVNETVNEAGLSYSINSGEQAAVHHFLEHAQMSPEDVVLLLVGTNNVREGDSSEAMLAEIRVLLDQIVQSEASPLVHLMKLTPISGDYWEDGDPSRTNNDTIAVFNQGLEALVADTYAAQGVTLVDSATTGDDRSPDGVHLNEAGYRKVAEAWLNSLRGNSHTQERATGGMQVDAAAGP